MDLLKAELERKRNVLRDDRSDGDKRKRYLTVAERRRIDEKEEEDTRREEERRKKKRCRQHHGDDNYEKEEEDLTTMITKKYDPITQRILSTNETTNDVTNSVSSGALDDNAGGVFGVNNEITPIIYIIAEQGREAAALGESEMDEG